MTEVADHVDTTEPVDASAADPDPQAVDTSTETDSVDSPDSDAQSGALNASQQATVRRLIGQRDQQWQQWHQSQQQTATATAAETAEVDEMTQELRGLYTDDEVGQKTFETIEKHLKRRMGTGTQSLTPEQVANIARGEADKVRNQVHK